MMETTQTVRKCRTTAGLAAVPTGFSAVTAGLAAETAGFVAVTVGCEEQIQMYSDGNVETWFIFASRR